MSEHDSSLIKTPKQLVVVVLAAFVIPIALAMLLANYAASFSKPAAGTEAFSAQAIEQRITPVTTFSVGAAKVAAGARTGEQLYQSACIACHDTGAAGAPKKGDIAAWSARIATGQAALLASLRNGKNAMPPKGGATDATEEELLRVLVYLVNASGGTLEEPPSK